MPDYFLAHPRRTWCGAVRAVNVGVAASAHDCACEAFAQLAGTFTDHGEVHRASAATRATPRPSRARAPRAVGRLRRCTSSATPSAATRRSRCCSSSPTTSWARHRRVGGVDHVHRDARPVLAPVCARADAARRRGRPPPRPRRRVARALHAGALPLDRARHSMDGAAAVARAERALPLQTRPLAAAALAPRPLHRRPRVLAHRRQRAQRGVAGDAPLVFRQVRATSPASTSSPSRPTPSRRSRVTHPPSAAPRHAPSRSSASPSPPCGALARAAPRRRPPRAAACRQRRRRRRRRPRRRPRRTARPDADAAGGGGGPHPRLSSFMIHRTATTLRGADGNARRAATTAHRYRRAARSRWAAAAAGMVAAPRWRRSPAAAAATRCGASRVRRSS